MLGKIEGKRRRGADHMVSIIDSMDMNLSKLWEVFVDRGASHSIVHGFAKSWTYLATEQQQQIFLFDVCDISMKAFASF